MTSHSRRWMCALGFAVFFVLPVTASAQKVAIVAAVRSTYAADVQAKLIGAGVSEVTIISVADDGTLPLPPTPTLQQLLQYDAILTFSDNAYASPDALGNVLADYVDSGRGVVQAVFSFNEDVTRELSGRWRADAYEPFSFATATRRVANLTLVKTQPSHPILANVASFNGGSFSYHGIVTPQGCADVVAHWSNGRPLVATRIGPHGGRIVGLNMFPVSSDAFSSFWNSSTDGGMLMANALRFAMLPAPAPSGPNVALLAADEAPWVQDVRCKLQDLQLFSRIDTIDVGTSTPTLNTLANYHAVLAWSNHSLNDPSGLGDVLADFVDQNGGVVQSVFSFDADDATRAIGGRWNAGGYRPFTPGSLVTGPNLTLLPIDAAHEILAGVSSFDGGLNSFHASPVVLDAASMLIASWSDGQPLAAAGPGPLAGRIVGLNIFPPSSDARFDSWSSASDGAQLIANALLYAAHLNRAPSAEAGSNQTTEATSPAGVSFNLSGSGSDPDGDALTYSWSGAVSATGQNIVVNLPPPAAPNKTQTFTVTLTVADGRGGDATDSVDLTVTDTTPPVLAGAPSGIVSAVATSAGGATVNYGPVTANDAVDGSQPVNCSPNGLFPVGDTTVTCSASDTRNNSVSHSFTVRVTPANTSSVGWMRGAGFVQDDGLRHEFVFAVRETPADEEWARISAKFKGRKGARGQAEGEFSATSVGAVVFDGPSVTFSGTGRWNGAPGFRYEVRAADYGEPGRDHDRLRIIVTAPGGSVVAHFDGVLDAGNIQSGRVQH